MFTPEEIEGRSFVMVRRGYDTDEVGAFLRAVADDVRRMQTELAEASRTVDPLEDAMADALGIVQSARESAARIEAKAEERAADRLRDLEDEAARRIERARTEARAMLDEARDQADAVIAEADARKVVTDADIAAGRNAWLRQLSELDILSRRRRAVLEEAQDSLEQWMSALRDIVVEASASASPVTDAQTVYPAEPVHTDAEVDVPAQESHDNHSDNEVYEGA